MALDDEDGDQYGDPYDFQQGWSRAIPDRQLVRQVRDAWSRWSREQGAAYEPQGLLGQLLWLARHSSNPAGSIGTTPSSFNRWLLFARGTTDKKGKRLGGEPSNASRAKIRAAVRREQAGSLPIPSAAVVSSILVWARYVNKGKEPLNERMDPGAFERSRRTTTFRPLVLDDSRDSWLAGRHRQSAQDFLDALHDTYGVPIAPVDCDTFDFLEW
jgi:hypothetical protein